MPLPAGQQRVLDAIEKSLQASEPRLTSLFAMFARLTRGEPPVRAERLPGRPRWYRSAAQMRAFVLIPVMAALTISGVLLGVTTRGAQACGAVYAAGRTVAVRTAASCARPLPARHPAATRQARTPPRPQPQSGPAAQPRQASPARAVRLAWPARMLGKEDKRSRHAGAGTGTAGRRTS